MRKDSASVLLLAFLAGVGAAEGTICADGAGCTAQQMLFEWITSNGGYINPNIELSTGPDPAWQVRGVFATDYIEEEKILFQLPMNLLMCAKTEDDGCELVNMLATEMEKGSESFFAPYISSLEDHYVDLPSLWSPEERALLWGLRPLDWTRHVDWYRGVCMKDVTDEAAKRALMLFVARSNIVSVYPCLSPMYDLFNHGSYDLHNVDVVMMGSKLTMVTTAEVEAGQQLFSNFGEEDVGRLFRDYGFISQRPRLWEIEGDDGSLHYFWEDLDDNGDIYIDFGEESAGYLTLDQDISMLTALKQRAAEASATDPDMDNALAGSSARIVQALEYRKAYKSAVDVAMTLQKQRIREKISRIEL